MPSDLSPPDRLWRFASDLYARPTVAPLCLALQDRDGWDVPLALFLLHTGVCAGRLPNAKIEEAARLSALWRAEAVAPLRALRRGLKRALAERPERLGVRPEAAAAARKSIQAAELAAERAQLDRLAELADDAEPPAGRAAAEAHLLLLRPAPRVEERADLERLIALAAALAETHARGADAAPL